MHYLHMRAIGKGLDRNLTAVMAGTAFVMVGICAVALGLLHEPLEKEFHWSNASISGLATVYSLAALLSGPLAGVLIDRFGCKPMMTLGIGLTAFGFFGLSLCSTIVQFYLAFGLIGIGYGGAFFLASTKIVATRQSEHKNIAMGIWMFSGSIGAALSSALLNYLIREFGWRSTSVAAAVVVALVLVTTVALVPADTPDTRDSSKASTGPHFFPPVALLLALGFVALTTAGMLASFGMSAIYFHIISIFVSAGFSETSASNVLAASWVLSAFGSLLTGAFPERVSKQKILGGSLLLGAIGTFALLLAPVANFGALAVFAFVVLWGATANAVNQLLPLLLVDSYGQRHLASLVGIQGALMGLVGSGAPLITGSLFDRYGGYRISVIASAATTLAAMLFVFLAKRKGSPGLRVGDQPVRTNPKESTSV